LNESRDVAALYSHFEEDGSIRAGSHRVKCNKSFAFCCHISRKPKLRDATAECKKLSEFFNRIKKIILMSIQVLKYLREVKVLNGL